ncbi:MAG: type II secretion system protein [Tumebacillaceae bacterium]
MRRRGRHFTADERGVTLPELLISLAILGMLLPVLAGELSSVSRLWNGATDRLEARGQAASLLRNVEGELREGKSFAVTPDGGVLFTNARGRVIRYYLSTNGLLVREEESLGMTVVGAKLSRCQFRSEAGGSAVRMQAAIQIGRAQIDLDESWQGRGTEL